MIFSRKKNKYFKLFLEFYPYIAKEAEIAVMFGPPKENHSWKCDNKDCPDCRFYAWGLNFQKRIKEGEFDAIINQRNKQSGSRNK